MILVSVPPTARSAAQVMDPWNNFFGSAPGSESGASGAQLNNTVPPGIRANNYWDNFRSFSRQNRLASASAANNLPNLSPIVAQVTPRQVPQLHLPHSPFRANNNTDLMADNTVMVEPYFSNSGLSSTPAAVRPRRKQKINREQNVSTFRGQSSGSASAASAMVFPMQSQEQQQNRGRQPRQNEVQPLHQQALNPVVTSIKRSIYSHVNELIAQNEERPESLAQIFHDLQNIQAQQQPLDSASNTPDVLGHQANYFLLSSFLVILAPKITRFYFIFGAKMTFFLLFGAKNNGFSRFSA